MGNFYTNFTLKTSDDEAIGRTLTIAGRSAYISPVEGDYVVVFDSETEKQDDRIIKTVGALLSESLQCPVLGVLNHDDDIFCYWLFDKGKLTDSYNSAPDYFDPEASRIRGGDLEVLCGLFGKPDALRGLQRVLYQEKYTFAHQQHGAFCEALGLPQCAVCGGFNYLEQGEVPMDMALEEFRRLGSR